MTNQLANHGWNYNNQGNMLIGREQNNAFNVNQMKESKLIIVIYWVRQSNLVIWKKERQYNQSINNETINFQQQQQKRWNKFIEK